MNVPVKRILATLALVGAAACGGTEEEPAPAAGPRATNSCVDVDTPGANAPCLSASEAPEYYVEQALSYFDTLDVDADRGHVPTYDPQVARWEWPPWLLLTALGREDMIEVNDNLRSLDPSTVPVRDCRFFDVQPFARCYVTFEYEQGSCPIYEEFTFDGEGEMTFVEAWSVEPGLVSRADYDRWAEAPNFPRLANRIPGLGTPTGSYDLDSSWMAAAADRDPEVADFVMRASDWWKHWFEALAEAEPGFFATGCGW